MLELNNIQSDMSQKELAEYIKTNSLEINDYIKTISAKIKSGEDKEQLFTKIEGSCSNSDILEYLKSKINNFICAYEETKFIRELSQHDFEEKISYLFDNMVIQYELLDIRMAKTSFNEPQLQIILRMFNTIMNYIIIKRYTSSNFKDAMQKMFVFDNQKIDYLWNLFSNNKDVLIKITLIKVLPELRELTISFKDFYTDFIDFLNDITSEDISDEEIVKK